MGDDRRARYGLRWGGTAALTAISTVFPLSFDEGAWIAISRKWASGSALYQGVVDNKSPVVYALMRFLDVLPGSYRIARGLFVSIAVIGVVIIAQRVAVALGIDRRRAQMVGWTLGATVVFQTVFVVSIELPAIVLFLGALLGAVRGRAVMAGLMMAAASSFDPRFAALLPGLLLVTRHGRLHITIAFAIPAVLAGAVILVDPIFRSALIGLNLATRSNVPWMPGVQIADGIRALLIPAVALIVMGSVRSGRGGYRIAAWTLFGPAIAVVLLSVRSFEPYWILPAAAFPVFAAVPSPRERGGYALLALAVIPGIVNASVQFADQSRRVARYQKAATTLDGWLPPGGKFAVFDQQPFMATFLPGKWVGRSPITDVYTLETALRSPAIEALSSDLDSVVVVVDDGVLDQPEASVFPDARALWRIFHDRLSEFDCVRTSHGIFLRFRSEACPSP